MPQIPKKTKIRFWRSESERKGVDRFIIKNTSKRLIVGGLVVFGLSLVFGANVLRHYLDSNAGTLTRDWSISGTSNGFGGNLGWNFAQNGVNGVQATNNAGENLKILYPAGGTFTQGLHGCWRLPVPANVTVNTVKLRLVANSAGANQVVIGIQNSDGYREPFVYAGALNGSEALDYGGLNVLPGSIIQVCNRVTEDGNAATPTTTFNTSRYVYVKDYAVFGTETVQIQDPYYYSVTAVQNPPTTMVVGQTADVLYQVKNEGTETWTGEGSANPVRLGTWNPMDHASPLYSQDGNWLNNSRIRMQETSVAPGQLATFKFRVTARAAGTVNEQLNLVREGIAWFPDRGIVFSVTTPTPSFSYDVVSAQNPPSVMSPGQKATVTYRLKNTGNFVWYGEGSSNPVRFGYWIPSPLANYDSQFYTADGSWLSKSRVKMQGSGILPGQEATFSYTVTAPNTPGTSYTEKFNLVAEGKTWFVDRGLNYTVRVGYTCTNNAGAVTTSVEAESSLCGPNNAPEVQADTYASGGKRVLLYATDQYAEYVFKPTVAGIYTAGGIMRSLDYNGSAVARITLTKLTPGTASVSTYEDRVAPGTAYDRRFMTVQSNLMQLSPAEITAGVSFKVRVAFTNDFHDSGGDRNLLVDTLYVEKTADLTTPQYCTNNGGAQTTSVEAEVSLCGPDTLKPVVQADAAASGTKRVLLYATNQYAEYNFKPTVSGIYTAGGIVRSLDYNGSANAKITMTKLTPGSASYSTTETRVAPGAGYDRRFITQQAQEQYLTSEQIAKGVSFTVRITYTNDYNDSGGDRNLLVDTLYIQKVAEAEISTAGCTATIIGTPTKVEAENVTRGPSSPLPSIVNDNNASGSKAVFLYATNQYVQYSFKVGSCQDGKYVPGVNVRGQDYPFGTHAQLELSLTANGVTTSRNFAAGLNYDVVRQYLTQDYRSLKAGDIATVKVRFVNDAHAATMTGADQYDDRNLFIDDVRLIKLPEDPADVLNIPHDHTLKAGFPAPNNYNIGNGAGSRPSNIESPYGTIQGEDSLRFGASKSVYDSLRAPVTAGVLFKNNDKLRHTFMDYSEGTYFIDVIARSSVLNDKLPGKIKITAYVSSSKRPILKSFIVPAGSINDPTIYARKSVKIVVPGKVGSDVRQRITVSIEFINDGYDSTTGKDRNVWIDYFRIRPKLATDSYDVSSTIQYDSPPASFIEAEGNSAETDSFNTVYSSNLCSLRGAPYSCSQLTEYDTLASEQFMVKVGNSSDYVQYRFIAPQDGNYSAGFSLRSQDYRGSAQARLTLDGTTQTITAPGNTYQFFSLPTTFMKAESQHTLKVEFLNDQCGYSYLGVSVDPCDYAHDRNLRVDQIKIQPVNTSTARSTLDRADLSSDPLVHVFYAIPADGVDHQYDTDGTITRILDHSQQFIKDQSGGQSYRYDTYGTGYDITFIKLNTVGAAIAGSPTEQGKEYDVIYNEIGSRGYFRSNRVNAVFYDGPNDIRWCGLGGGNLAVSFMSCNYSDPGSNLSWLESTNLQETTHALGFMQHYFGGTSVPASCAPNEGVNGATPGHIGVSNDFMSYNHPTLYMDKNHTDYFNHNNPDPSCLDLARSRYLTL